MLQVAELDSLASQHAEQHRLQPPLPDGDSIADRIRREPIATPETSPTARRRTRDAYVCSIVSAIYLLNV